MSRIALVVLGLAVGWLAATQFPIWPTRAGGWFDGWSGTFRASNGHLYQDKSSLICPSRLGDYEIVRALYIANSGPTCSYATASLEQKFWISLHAVVPDAFEMTPTTVRAPIGDIQARRVVHTTDYGGMVQEDMLIISGVRLALWLSCISSGAIDERACDAARGEFIASFDFAGIGL